MLTWDDEEIFFDGDQYFDRLIKDIDHAQKYITVEVYIFNDDLLGKKLAAHLIMAQQRGVKVQIIVDGVGSYLFNKLHTIFKKNRVAVKIYNPLPFYHPFYGKQTLPKKIQILMLRFGKLNKRNHRKIITIDEKIMYTGSYNFTWEHTHLYDQKPWKDMGVRVCGEHVKFAVLNFKKNWKLREYYRYRKQQHLNILSWKKSLLRLNHNLFMKRFYYKDLLKRITNAQQHVWLTTPYFIPKRKLIKTISLAAARGVDVKILISSRSDILMFRTLQFFYYPYLIKKGVKVFLYTETVLHAKNFIIDNWTTIGTSNLNHRSFLHDLEVDLIIEKPENVGKVQQNFVESVSTSQEVTLESLKKRPLWDRFLARVFFIFKYWF